MVPLSLFCNTLLLVVLIRTGHIRKRSSFLATNLALIDLFCTISIGFSELYFAFKHEHFLGKIGCKTTSTAYTLYFSGSTLLMVFSSLERYYHAMLLHSPPKKWKMKLLLGIVYSYLSLLVFLTIYGTSFNEADGVCIYEIYFMGFSKSAPKTKTFHIVTGFLIPGIILGVVFFKIRQFLEEDARKYSGPPKQSSTSTSGTNQLQVADGLRRNTTADRPTGAIRSRNRIFYMLALSVFCFYVCGTLYVIMTSWKLIAEITLFCIFPAQEQIVHVFSILAYPLLIVNCAINPNIYLTLSKRFRTEIKVMTRSMAKLLCCGRFATPPSGAQMVQRKHGRAHMEPPTRKSTNISDKAKISRVSANSHVRIEVSPV